MVTAESSALEFTAYGMNPSRSRSSGLLKDRTLP
jgi:hypothetical protein